MAQLSPKVEQRINDCRTWIESNYDYRIQKLFQSPCFNICHIEPLPAGLVATLEKFVAKYDLDFINAADFRMTENSYSRIVSKSKPSLGADGMAMLYGIY